MEAEMKYLCIARRDLREGPDLEVGFYDAASPEDAYQEVLANFTESNIGRVVIYTVDNETCQISEPLLRR
jgi:hypothetical protein